MRVFLDTYMDVYVYESHNRGIKRVALFVSTLDFITSANYRVD